MRIITQLRCLLSWCQLFLIFFMKFLLPSGSLLTEIVFLTAFCKSYFVSLKAVISLDFERNFSLICQPPRKKNKIDKSDIIAGGRKDVDASPGKGTMSFVPDLMTLNCSVNKE